ncbi:MAG: thioredoxin [Wenzhouxiangellaceae bacterium]
MAARLAGLLVLASLWLPAVSLADEPASDRVAVYVFKSATCPHCQAQREFLDELEQRHPRLEIQHLEIMATREHHDFLRELATAYDVRPGSVPMVFIGNATWTGDSPQIRDEINRKIEQCLETGCADPREIALERNGRTAEAEGESTVISIPFLGSIDLGHQPLLLSTSIIAFVDGFNPCSLWLLTILIALVIHSGSRKRVAIVGITFLTVTALVYGLFMIGVFSVLAYVSFLPWMYWIVALFALTFGAVNIKDYFWFKKGISFTIDDRHKPGIFKKFRDLMANGRSSLALAGATVVMAAGIALIELPCTAGFPVIWSGLVASHEVGAAMFAVLLMVYLLIYLLDELVIFGIAVVKLRIDRFEERHARILKLIGGVVMVALALVLITEPEIMSNTGQALAVFAVSFLLAGLIVLVDRKLLVRYRESRGKT